MKKLFSIKDLSTNRVIEGKDYEQKVLAKEERRKLNGLDETGNEKQGRYVVTLGADHKDYVSDADRKERDERHEQAQIARSARSGKRRKESVQAD